MSKNILVVEDEPDLRTTLEFNLKSEGYKVKSAADGGRNQRNCKKST